MESRAACWAELSAHGLRRRAIATAVHEGRVVKEGRGLMCLPGAERSDVTRALLVGWLVIEVDGYAFHRDRFVEDRRRDAELVRQTMAGRGHRRARER